MIAWQVLRLPEREPVYQGKRLSVWLETYSQEMMTSHHYVGPEEQAIWLHQIDSVEQAIRHIGTNALPVLIVRLRAQDTLLKELMMTSADKQKLVHFHFKSADQRRGEAVWGYEALGPLARAQVPSLITTLTNDRSPMVRQAAASALAAIGPEARLAAPALFHAAKETNVYVRCCAFIALTRIRPDPHLTVPVLVAGLDDPFPVARLNAATALGNYGSEAREAVPALRRMLATNSAFTVEQAQLHTAAADALKAIDPEAAAQAGVK
ncbi:MAG: HEAT repeat domain-containing protein [Limisphaerales bacterium]